MTCSYKEKWRLHTVGLPQESHLKYNNCRELILSENCSPIFLSAVYPSVPTGNKREYGEFVVKSIKYANKYDCQPKQTHNNARFPELKSDIMFKNCWLWI